FAKVAERLMKMPLRVQSTGIALRNGHEISDSLPDNALLMLTAGPGDGVGLVALAPDALSCLLEVMTTGHLRDHAAPPRRPTRTDSAIVAGFVDAALAEIADLLEEEDRVWAEGFHFSTHLPDPRPLAMLLEEPAYRTFKLHLAFGVPLNPEDDLRSGEIYLAYPAVGKAERHAPPPAEVADPAGPAAEGWALALEQSLLPATVAVQGVLARLTLPLAALLDLTPGKYLSFPAAALTMVRLEGEDGRAVCHGQLGQVDGQRALRLQILDRGQEADGFGLVPLPSEVISAQDQPFHRATGRGKASVHDHDVFATGERQHGEETEDQILSESLASHPSAAEPMAMAG
ncbi:MAG: FliM/FliN family flagellar motor switch protein, partial [Rhodobacteraceae bacterium]|nr:FliM/FliN family flagellar motor switch protein [Paracoccaceae bacterium]